MAEFVLLPSQIIADRYTVVRQIGAGGMGAVYEVFQSRLGQRAALKVLTGNFAADPTLFERFKKEAMLANRIQHPGVPQVYDFGQIEDGPPYMVMEYLEGEPLSDRIRRAAKLPGHAIGLEGLRLIADLFSIARAAHAKGVIHRDIKPQNIMIVSDDSATTGERPKLLDFGVAKLHGEDLTQKGLILGTIAYMAPEQILNASTVDGKADVYGLGVVLYQMLCGRLPHRVPENNLQALAAAKFLAPEPITKHAPDLPPEVTKFVMSLLEHERDDRPTAAEAESEARRVLGLPPRQTGTHDALIAPVSVEQPKPQPRPAGSDESLDTTADVPSQALEALQVLEVGTPSDQKISGEISPRSLHVMMAMRDANVPISVSEVKTAPVEVDRAPTQGIPIRLATSEDSTAGGARKSSPSFPVTTPSAPTMRQPPLAAPVSTPSALAMPQPPLAAPVSTPSAPMMPQQQPAAPVSTPRGYWLGALAAVIVAMSVVLTTMITRESPKSAARVSDKISLPPPVDRPPSVAPPPTASVPAAPSTPVPIKATLDVNTTTTKEPLVSHDSATESSKAHAGAKASKASASKPCEASFPTPRCIVGPRLSAVKQEKLLRAFRESGATLCPGERLRLDGLPKRAGASIVPGSMDKNPTVVIRLTRTLIGLLSDEDNFPHQVDLECPVH